MNNELYEDLKEYCGYNLSEVEKTIDYFKKRIEQDLENEEYEKEFGRPSWDNDYVEDKYEDYLIQKSEETKK